MPHPPALLQKVQSLVATSYPEDDGFRYSFEEMIRCHDGRRMAPDIIVRTAGGDYACLVEIGYTRPEKLSYYRSVLKVPDVRWYDKSGVLHGDVEEKSVIVRREVSYEVDPRLTFRVVKADWQVACPGCWEDLAEVADADDALEEASQDNCGVVFFSEAGYLPIVDCDACGGVFPMDESDAGVLRFGDLARWWRSERRSGQLPDTYLLELDRAKFSWRELEELLAPLVDDFSYGLVFPYVDGAGPE